MIDIHSHLLPGIDDGPEWLGQSLHLALVATDNGISHSVVTPHIHAGRYENNAHIIKERLLELQEALVCHDIPLLLGMAAEVRIGPEIIILLEKNLIPFLGEYYGKQVMLLEFPHSHIPPGSEKLIHLLLDKGIRPIIAHPERNKDVLRDVEKIAPFVDLGCLLQVTAGSVAGMFGSACQVRAQQLLERDWVTVLATDAHNLEHRPPDLKSGYLAAEKIVGESLAWDLVCNNPWSIVATQFEDTPTVSSNHRKCNVG